MVCPQNGTAVLKGLMADFLKSLRYLYSVSLQFFCFIVFLFPFSGFLACVAFSYPVRWHVNCLTIESAISFLFFGVLFASPSDHRTSTSLERRIRTDTGCTDEAA